VYSRLLELTASQFDQWGTDLHFNYRTKDTIFKNKENLVFSENALRLALFVTLDLTGYLEFSWSRSHLDFAELNELTHSVSDSDIVLLKQTMDIVDFFYGAGTPPDLSLADLGATKIDAILPDWLLQCIFLLLDAQDQKGMDSLDIKMVDRIRRILLTKMDDDHLEAVQRKRRIMAILFLSSKLILNSCKNLPSV